MEDVLLTTTAGGVFVVVTVTVVTDVVLVRLVVEATMVEVDAVSTMTGEWVMVIIAKNGVPATTSDFIPISLVNSRSFLRVYKPLPAFHQRGSGEDIEQWPTLLH
jgi:hypothetical protein